MFFFAIMFCIWSALYWTEKVVTNSSQNSNVKNVLPDLHYPLRILFLFFRTLCFLVNCRLDLTQKYVSSCIHRFTWSSSNGPLEWPTNFGYQPLHIAHVEKHTGNKQEFNLAYFSCKSVFQVKNAVLKFCHLSSVFISWISRFNDLSAAHQAVILATFTCTQF